MSNLLYACSLSFKESGSELQGHLNCRSVELGKILPSQPLKKPFSDRIEHEEGEDLRDEAERKGEHATDGSTRNLILGH